MTELIEIVTPTIEELKEKLESMFEIKLMTFTYDMGTYVTNGLKMWSPFFLELEWGRKVYKYPGEEQKYYWLMMAKSETSREIYYQTPICADGLDDWNTVIREMSKCCKLRKVQQQKLF